MLSIPALTAALQSIGNAKLYVGDFLTASGAAALAHKEGPITVALEESYSDLTAPEVTGPAIHDRILMGVSGSITFPAIIDNTVWANITGAGTAGGGWSSPVKPIVKSVAIIPDYEVGGGLSHDGTAWTRLAGFGVLGASGAGAAPKNAHWFWRCTLSRGEATFSHENGGKMIVAVTIQPMFDPSKPEGNKLWSVGDPRALSVPIPVLL